MVWQRLRRLKETGTTMILTTHYLEEASQLCDRLIVLHRGNILEEGTPPGLVERHVGRQALELGLDPGHMDKLADGLAGLIKASHVLGDEMVLFTDHGRELAARINARAGELGLVIAYQKLRQSNLEDVFLKLTGESLAGGGGEDRGGDC
jgi:lipooligosaccharide transport system ATP-binding protein